MILLTQFFNYNFFLKFKELVLSYYYNKKIIFCNEDYQNKNWNKMKDEFLEHNMVIYIKKGISIDFYSE